MPHDAKVKETGFEATPSSPINWLGVVAGILMIALPFFGPWWVGTVGTGALVFKLSPFYLSMSFMGQVITSSLLSLFLLAAEVAIVLGGVFMIIGSVLPERWWSKQLVKFGAMKPLWAIVGLVISLVVISFFINNILPGLLPGILGQSGAAGEVLVQFSLPYITGTGASAIQVGSGITVNAPVTFALTPIFWVAVVAAVLGVAARIYHRRYTVS